MTANVLWMVVRMLLECYGSFRVFSVAIRMFLVCKDAVRMLFMFLGLLGCC